jgi:hypothetical protein
MTVGAFLHSNRREGEGELHESRPAQPPQALRAAGGAGAAGFSVDLKNWTARW